MLTSDELSRSYRLRYHVYCEERGFLQAKDYPDGLERDLFDNTSLHFGSYNADGELVGTARLVLPSALQFPMYQHCTIFPEWRTRLQQINGLVEISRLAISRRYRRREGDGLYGVAGPARGRVEVDPQVPDRRGQYELVVSLFKGMYQAARTMGFTHALSAMELSLHRLLSRYHFPLEAIGPECDYFGPVTPFLIDVAKLEHKLATECPDLLEEFSRGLSCEDAVAIPVCH